METKTKSGARRVNCTPRQMPSHLPRAVLSQSGNRYLPAGGAGLGALSPELRVPFAPGVFWPVLVPLRL
jgi:hypothetical protein